MGIHDLFSKEVCIKRSTNLAYLGCWQASKLAATLIGRLLCGPIRRSGNQSDWTEYLWKAARPMLRYADVDAAETLTMALRTGPLQQG